MTLDQIRLCYQVSRDNANKIADDLAAANGWNETNPKPSNVCRYCGRGWRVWNNSSLDGDARCYVTLEFKCQVSDWIDANPQLSYQAVANSLGVTYSIIRAWVDGALKSRGLPGLR